jgi:hypothetical protein
MQYHIGDLVYWKVPGSKKGKVARYIQGEINQIKQTGMVNLRIQLPTGEKIDKKVHSRNLSFHVDDEVQKTLGRSYTRTFKV